MEVEVHRLTMVYKSEVPRLWIASNRIGFRSDKSVFIDRQTYRLRLDITSICGEFL